MGISPENASLLEKSLQSKEIRDILAVALHCEDRGLWKGLAVCPPGSFLDEVCQAFYEGTDIPLELPFWVAFQHAASYMSEQGAGFHIPDTHQRKGLELINLILAPSATAKTYTWNTVARILAPAYQMRTIGDAASSAKFLEDLAAVDGKPVCWLCDEFGPTWKSIKSSEAHADTKKYLLKCYDGDPIERRTLKNVIKVEKPRLSIFAMSVDSTFHDKFDADDWNDGWAYRMNFITTTRDPSRKMEDFPRLVPNEDRIFDSFLNLLKTPIHADYRFNEPAIELLDESWRQICAYKVEDSFKRRINLRTYVYAVIYHWVCGKVTDVVDEYDVKWAVRLSHMGMQDIAKVIKQAELHEYRELLRKAYEIRDRLREQYNRNETSERFTYRSLYMRCRAGRVKLKNVQEAKAIVELMDSMPLPPSDLYD